MLKILKTISIILVGLISMHSQSAQAYWGEPAGISLVASSAISIGEWLMPNETYWEDSVNYVEGDLVYYNGKHYIRTNQGLGIDDSPEGPKGWLIWSLA